MIEPPYPQVTPLQAALSSCCPRCGQGRMFDGFLSIAKTCDVCGLDLRGEDSGDGPIAFIILIVGAIVVGLVLAVEVSYQPPMYVHLAYATPLILGLSLGMMRPFKAILLTIQYNKKSGEEVTTE